MNDTISREAVIRLTWEEPTYYDPLNVLTELREKIKALPPVESEGYVKIPDSGIEDLSDGFHTFRQLYYQRMILFATMVKQNRERAWKSLRHEDGELCFGGEWFIVGIDTPEGSYTYHYEANYFSMFDCEELERGKHWDGHTEKDVVRLLSLPSAEPEQRWIPVSERLPNTNGVYNVTRKISDGFEYRNISDICYYDGTNTWHDDTRVNHGRRYLTDVIAWMPLPESYKGGKE